MRPSKDVREKRRSTVKTVIIVTILGVLCVLFAHYASQIVGKLREYKESKDVYDIIADTVVERDYDPLDAEAVDDDSIHIDWEKFKDTDVIGWLQLDDIGYPILQGADDSYYLHKLPDGTYNYGGSLFLQAENRKDFSDDVSFVYGHNMADGSMFGTLKKYTDEKYKNHTFDIYRPDGTRHTYTFFSVLSVEKNDRAYTFHFVIPDDFIDYQKYVQEKSLYANDPKPDRSNHLVSLSTCNGYQGTSHRLLVQGVETKVRKTQKPASWYSETWEQGNAQREESIAIFKEMLANGKTIKKRLKTES